MPVPSRVTIAAAVVMAFPFGWGLGALAAYVIAGRNFGQLPLVTVPLGILAAVVFALWPSFRPITRLKVTFGGTIALVLFAWLIA